MSLPDLNNAPAAPGTATSGRKSLGNLAEAQHKKLLRSAKIAIGFVGILTLGANYFVYSMVEQNSQSLELQITAAKNNPNLVLDQALVAKAREEIADARVQTIGFMVMGGIFIVCLFFVNSHPVPATMTAFILYIAGWVIGVGLDPTNAAKGIIIKVIIVAALYKGMQAGQAIQKLRNEGRAA